MGVTAWTVLCCRYVEVFEANPLDVEKAKDREEGGGGGGGGGRRMDDGGHTVQLRGLPYKASEREIADWLSEAADPEDVIIIMDRLVDSSSHHCYHQYHHQDWTTQWTSRCNIQQ